MAFSKSKKRKFFFNMISKQSTFELPNDSVAPFHVCFTERLFWEWCEGVQLHDAQKQGSASDKLSKDNVLSFIQQHLQHQ